MYHDKKLDKNICTYGAPNSLEGRGEGALSGTCQMAMKLVKSQYGDVISAATTTSPMTAIAGNRHVETISDIKGKDKICKARQKKTAFEQ